MTNLEADLHERWLPSAEQMRQAEAMIRLDAEGAQRKHVFTPHILVNKRFGFWTLDVKVEPIDGVFFTREGACYAAQTAARRAHEALGVPVVGGYAMHYMRDGKCEAAVWDDIMSVFPENPKSAGTIVDLMEPDEAIAQAVVSRLAERHGWTYGIRDRSDVDHWLGRAVTDDEWERIIGANTWDSYFDGLDDDRSAAVLNEAGMS